MTNSDFETRWAEVSPDLTELLKAYIAVNQWKPDHESKMANVAEMIRLAVNMIETVGIAMPESVHSASSSIFYNDVSQCLMWFYYRAFHAAGLAPGGQRAEEISVTANYLPLVRIDAPAWFSRADFVRWLCADTTATWHRKLNITKNRNGRVTSVSNNTRTNDFSDVFFTWSDVTAGSDYPGTDDVPGIPVDIWEFICDSIVAQLGYRQEALVWVSNVGWKWSEDTDSAE